MTYFDCASCQNYKMLCHVKYNDFTAALSGVAALQKIFLQILDKASEQDSFTVVGQH